MKKLLLIICLLLSTLLLSNSVFADGAVPGSVISGGACRYWCVGKGGAWQTFLITKDLPPEGVHLGYTKNTGGPVNIKGCNKGQYIYNFGLVVFEGAHVGTQVATVKRTTANGTAIGTSTVVAIPGPGYGAYQGYSESINNTGAPSTIQNYTEAKRYITNSEALKNFNAMKEYVKNNPNVPFTGDKDISWNDIGAFCFSEESLTPYYSVSHARVGEGMDYYKGTGIKTTQTSVSTKPMQIQVGEWTDVTLSHGIFTTNKTSEKTSWAIRRFVKVNNEEKGSNGFYWTGYQDYYEIKNGKSGDYEGQANFTAKYDGTYYEPQAQADNENHAITRDSFDISFKQPGTYEICEEIRIPSSASYKTRACAVIEVTEPTQYFSKSHVSNEAITGTDKDYKYTEVSNTPETARTDDIRVDVNGTADIILSHNIYSKNKQDDRTTKYYIKRTVNNKSGITSSDYTIDSTDPPAGTSSGGTGEKVEGTANFTEKKGSDLYYIGGPRAYSDGNTKYDYILRDYYKITFKQKGIYDFCETVYIKNEESGQYQEFTSACSRVLVGDVVAPTDGDCADISWFNPKSGETSVASAIRNTSVSGYSTWTNQTIYAKPNDNIQWLHCYYSGVQSKAGDEVTENQDDRDHDSSLSSGAYPNTNIPISTELGTKWQNQFTVSTQKDSKTTVFPTSKIKSSSTTIGSTIGKVSTEKFNDNYTIQYKKSSSSKSDTGLKLTESIKSGKPSKITISSKDHSWDCDVCPNPCGGEDEEECGTCSKACYHGSSGEFITYSGENSTASDSASVIVPYNFNIGEVKVNLGENHKDEENQKTVFAGETIDITNMSVEINPKSNSVTSGTYATRADDVKLRLIAYASTTNANQSETHSGGSGDCSAIGNDRIDCSVIAKDTTSLNKNPEDIVSGKTENHLSGIYNVFDVDAGLYYCVVAAVYPSSSGIDTQTSTSGNGEWAVSAPSCVKVAKRPSLQIWGASLYSTGNLVADPAIKRVVDGVYSFEDGKNGDTANSKANQTVFGSWVEYSITSTGENGGYTSYGGIASGASTGAPGDEHYRTGTLDRSPNESLGGSHEGANVSLCDYRSPLTIPNEPCGGPGNLTPGGETSSATPTDKSSLLSNFTDKENGTYTYLDNYSNISSFIASDELGNVPVIELGKTYVLESKVGNDLSSFTIDSDITYENTTYSITSEIPKLIIHAKNININCNVENIHAVLIAEETVDTCSDIDTINSAEASTPLKIFGTVISDKLVANRTYGSATGINTSVPAEIIDYDTSLYLWGSPRANTDTSGKTTVTYQTELAPRL